MSVQAAHRAAAVKPTAQQRKRYDAAYRAKRRKAGKGKHAGHLSGAAWHAARARAA